MKIIGNWGLWIVIALVIFLCYIAAFIIFASREKFDIVDSNYYEKGLQYQKQIDTENRTGSLNGQLKITKNTDASLAISFPKDFAGQNIEGNILFYRPSDSRLDRKVKLELDTNLTQIINYSYLAKGVWVIKIFWKVKESDATREFYHEEEIIL